MPSKMKYQVRLSVEDREWLESNDQNLWMALGGVT
jgi:hypothetical protein